MSKKVIISLFFVFSLSFMFSNEIVKADNLNFNFKIDNSSQITNFKSSNKNSNILKSKIMEGIGNIGIPFAGIGGTTTIGGLIIFGIFYSNYVLTMEKLSPDYITYDHYLFMIIAVIGVSISIVGLILLFTGIVIMAVGYGVSKYFLHKEQKKVSLQPFISADENGFKSGFSIDFL
ncbi:MAG: hypothetical protein A2015_04255 [Spirochaetes bacterium GWF1_31_7]|nr:MAG: hypothetical protein A2Y30_17015 [Spirochaetes bacterium GWE1_32_154]OHD47400.1 MAG: hypothetical protein A2Y29_10025 [Spirochaetes bacterium GWE2_31_10]OHD52933.1 MAG: hypothetical protein A2015_04255 [Spirochaetes bacterium GWF1_31_7]OHD77747.1 MAG: hypothetical protein A2355_06865 [Spirochaetes bacterium RIFOXYB1_FULL_32_8]HBD93676.1 hypothetical protein [Spirochaetia bacterium]